MLNEKIKILMESQTEIFKLVHQYSYQELEKLELYPGQPQLLVLIKSKKGITQKELADKRFVKPATITGMINKLEMNQLAYRSVDDEDKRIMRVYLTDKGNELASQSEKYLLKLYSNLFDGFNDEELESYLYLTNKIRNNLLEAQIGRKEMRKEY